MQQTPLSPELRRRMILQNSIGTLGQAQVKERCRQANRRPDLPLEDRVERRGLGQQRLTGRTHRRHRRRVHTNRRLERARANTVQLGVSVV